jgi:hypothetical protein
MNYEPGWPKTAKMHLMSRLKKTLPWLNLAIGLVWILVGLRNLYLPDFLSISHLSHADKASLAPMELIVGVLWFLGGGVGLFQGRRNPEAKVDLGVTTILDRQ